MNAIKKLTKARSLLVLDAPFFGSLALRLTLVEDNQADTAYTNGVVIGYKPEYVCELTMKETLGLIAHEVMHLACMHHTRRAGRDFSKWNVAADLAINGILKDSGFEVPPGSLFDSRYAGRSAEAIYATLPENNNKDNKGGQEDDYSTPGSETTLGPGEVHDAPGSGADIRQVEAQWRVSMAQAAQQAKSMGNLPAELKRIVDTMLYPAVDWRELLRHYLDQAACNDYSWLHPSRRYLDQGLILPGLHSKELGKLVVAVDTSGSIDMDELDRFAAEISAVLEAFDVSIDVLYCDSRVQGHHQYDRQDLPLKVEPKGGGGTDFRPVFEWVEDNDISPCCLVYLTDLECQRFPGVIPDYPVLWVQTGRLDRQVPFGEVVQLQ